ncbi:hypothetical protein C3F09_08035, partial [candidate division GN15 bacterium]
GSRVARKDLKRLTKVYVEQFLEYCEPILADPETPPHILKVSEDKTSARLEFPPQDAEGFTVAITADLYGIVVHAGELEHVHFEEGLHITQDIENAFGYARDLLSPKMRLLERLAGSKVYWSGSEYFDGKVWRFEHWTGSLFFNYFGKRTSHLKMNRQLPARIDPL